MEEIIIDDTIEEGVPFRIEPDPIIEVSKKPKMAATENKEYINCLRSEKIIVRYLNKDTGFITNPKHVMYGGMAETASRTFGVPILSNGAYKNVLTKAEKEYLEVTMGMDANGLSVYLKEGNYWDTALVRLTKQDTFLDLSNPADYIKYKILMANSDFVAPSLEYVKNQPKATYQFVLIAESDELKVNKDTMTASIEASIEFGKVGDNKDILRIIVESLEGKPISASTKLDFLKVQAYRLMQANPKLFLSIAQDQLLPTKVLLKKAIESGVVKKRGDYYYMSDDNRPLASNDVDPTLSNAVKYLNLPENQSLKLMIEAKVKLKKD